ncbi:carbohydrate esterase family 16 protein [Pleurotus ostreatus PC15]|uniref:Carbohydrate esterase family 16 protein n=1 Tax=Pleurotus ostreatus (strain PC15) TaxID=1137138 RepID=A0A067NHL7_PLEO1|nr:carbohydrate esterase family 16 protein [Pleurotus ostreatus PC15]
MLTLLSAIIFILAPVALAQQSAWGQCSGDSYTQTGFDPSGAIPSLANPIGNPPFPGFTATGGANWVGFGTTTFNKSKIFTYNYAYGGATIDANLVAPYTPTVISLTQQVDQFLTTVANKPPSTPWTSANSLFSVFIGINDIGNSYYLSGDRAAFSDTLLNAEFALVEKLVPRNFLFVNVPPIDRSPLVRTLPDNHARLAEKTVIQGFNSKLAAKIAAFKANHTGVETYTWDSSATFTRILDSPTTYGFRDATTFGDGTGIFWGNNYHPSSQAHQIFAQDVATVLQSTIW